MLRAWPRHAELITRKDIPSCRASATVPSRDCDGLSVSILLLFRGAAVRDERVGSASVASYAPGGNKVNGNGHHDLRHQELRYDEEGARLAGPARRRLRVSRLQGERDRG